MFQEIIYQPIDGVAVVSINRADKLNALNYNVIKEFLEVLEMVRDDDSIGCILLRGEGKAFSSGFDIGEDVEEEQRGFSIWGRWDDQQTADARRDIFFNYPKPTVCEIKGYCLGAGYELAQLADILIAADDCKIGITELKLSLTPLVRSQYFCNNIHLAKEFLMMAEFIGPEDAKRLGIVNRVVPRAELESETMKVAKRLARMPAEPMRMLKRELNQCLNLQGFDTMTKWGSDIGILSSLIKPKVRVRFDQIAVEQGMKAAFKWMNDYFNGLTD